MSDISPVDDLDKLSKILSGKYGNLRPFKQGGTRVLYLSDWGAGKQRRIIKVDRLNLDSPRAIRHVGRGCNTANDIRHLCHIEDAELHHLMPLLDYFQDENLTVSVEPYYESKSLDEMIQSPRMISIDCFEQVFSKVIHGVRYLNEVVGIFHRDLHPSNILIKENGEFDVRITDFANAKRRDEVQPNVLPTMGAHLISDPRLLGRFTGIEREYDESAEIHALGICMYYTLQGKYPFEFDVDSGIAIDLETGESLLKDDGKLDFRKYEKSLKRKLTSLGFDFFDGGHRYSNLIYRCLTLNEKKKIKSLEELSQEFDSRKNKYLMNSPWFDRIGAGFVFTTLGSFALVCLGAVGTAVYDLVTNEHTFSNLNKPKLEQIQKYEVGAEWDAGKLEINNNLVGLDATALIPLKLKGACRMYPDYEEGCSIKPGEKLNFNITSRFKAVPGGTRGMTFPLDGSFYFEGYDSKNFVIHPDGHDTMSSYDEGWAGYRFDSINVPEDLRDGVYILALELYAPDNNFNQDDKFLARFNFLEPGKILARKRIPIVVGNPRHTVDVSGVRFGFWPYLTVENLGRDRGSILLDARIVDPSLKYESAIPELGFKDNYQSQNRSNSFGTSLKLPNCKGIKAATFQFVTRNEQDAIVSYTFLPIHERVINNYSLDCDLTIPGREFSRRLIRYRKQIFD
ncbi:protein kinase [Candidatus Woesearchaeota archaeon]|nr:protein kinase [Candidatus Woesearchaeota archaeon]